MLYCKMQFIYQMTLVTNRWLWVVASPSQWMLQGANLWWWSPCTLLMAWQVAQGSYWSNQTLQSPAYTVHKEGKTGPPCCCRETTKRKSLKWSDCPRGNKIPMLWPYSCELRVWPIMAVQKNVKFPSVHVAPVLLMHHGQPCATSCARLSLSSRTGDSEDLDFLFFWGEAYHTHWQSLHQAIFSRPGWEVSK